LEALQVLCPLGHNGILDRNSNGNGRISAMDAGRPRAGLDGTIEWVVVVYIRVQISIPSDASHVIRRTDYNLQRQRKNTKHSEDYL
jgi:hypothetical protein